MLKALSGRQFAVPLMSKELFADSRVVLKRINRIVGTDHLHIHLLHDSAGGEGTSQQIITLVPDPSAVDGDNSYL